MLPSFYVLLESWVLIVPLLLMCIVASLNEWDADVFFGLIGLFVILYNVGITWSDVHWYHGVAYIAIGICWCLFRYREFIKETSLKFASGSKGDNHKVHYFKNEVSWNRNVDKVNSWVFNWHSSMFVYFTRNFFTLFDKLVLGKIRSYFENYIEEKAKSLE